MPEPGSSTVTRGWEPTPSPACSGTKLASLPRFDRLLAWIALLLACVVILADAGLILGGRWDGDEFLNFAYYRQNGLQFLGFRLLTWSPRPVSEGALFLYAMAVQLANAPLIAPFLAVLWATLVGCAVVAAWRRGSARSLYRMNLGLCLVAMFLLGHPINEMFFWPMSAAPYLLALAALVIVTFQILHGDTGERRGRLIVGIALSAAVLSSETGLFFSVGFAAALCVLEPPGIGSGGLLRLKRAGWYLVPLVLSLGELACAFRYRVGDATQGVGPTEVYFHHVWPSLLATLQAFPIELTWSKPNSLAFSLLLKFLLLLGFFGVWCRLPAPAPRWHHMIALAAGLLSAMVLIIFASFYQYSSWGFERHRTFFQCLLVMLLLVGARGLAAKRRMPARIVGTLGPLSLAAAMAIGLAPRLSGIIGDYALLPQIREARFQTWDSGRGPGAEMRFVLPPHGHVLEGMVWQTGHFPSRSDPKDLPWYVPGVLNFFGKESINIVQGGDHAGNGG